MIPIILAIIVALAGALAWAVVSAFFFFRCPHCGCRGGWRFESIGQGREPEAEDPEFSTLRGASRCRACGSVFADEWSPNEGRRLKEIRGRP